MICFDLIDFPKMVILGRKICGSDWRYSNYITQNYELMILYQGEAFVTLDNDEYAMVPGDCLLLLPNQVFHGRTNPDKPCRYYIVHFTLDSPVENSLVESAFEKIKTAINAYNQKEINDIFKMPQINYKTIYLLPFLNLGETREIMFDILEKAIKERNQLNLSSEIVISCYLCEILIHLSRLTVESLKIDLIFNHHSELPRTVQEAVFYIHENYTRRIGLNDLCKHLKITPQSIIRIFKKNLNKTPLQYINLFRISRAKDLLQYTSLTVKEISYEIGMENPYYFCRLFKKTENVTPSQFRKKNLLGQFFTSQSENDKQQNRKTLTNMIE